MVKGRAWLRRLTYRLRYRRRTCLECGFLAFDDGSEIAQGARWTIAAKGSDGWFTKEDAVNCFKHLWDWRDDSAFNIIVHEANRVHRCASFLRYAPGRSPKEHMALEDEHRSFRQQFLLALLAFFGAMVGAWIGSKG